MLPPEPPRQDKGWVPQAPLGNALLAPMAGMLMAEAYPEEVISGLQCEMTNTPSELMQQEGKAADLVPCLSQPLPVADITNGLPISSHRARDSPKTLSIQNSRQL